MILSSLFEIKMKAWNGKERGISLFALKDISSIMSSRETTPLVRQDMNDRMYWTVGEVTAGQGGRHGNQALGGYNNTAFDGPLDNDRHTPPADYTDDRDSISTISYTPDIRRDNPLYEDDNTSQRSRQGPHPAFRDQQRDNQAFTQQRGDNPAFRDEGEDQSLYQEEIDELSDLPEAPFTTPPAPDGAKVQEELFFKLRIAHLSPGVDWFQEVCSAAKASHDDELFSTVLHSLREYPLCIMEKQKLSYQLRSHIEQMGGFTLSISRMLTSTKPMTSSTHGGRQRSHFLSTGNTPFGLWENSLSRIAAYFGTNVASYFRFLRFLTLLNAGVGLIMLVFISLPQIIPLELISDDIESGFFGDMSRTIFFYGAYSNSSWGNNDVTYERPLAYLLTWSGVNIMAVLAICANMYLSYKKIKASGDEGEAPYSTQTLIGWDFSVTSREGTRMRAVALRTHLREMMREESVKKSLSVLETCRLYLVRIVFNLLSLCVLGGSAVLIVYVAQNSISVGDVVPEEIGDFWKKYQLTVLVSGLKLVIPVILNALLNFEHYHPRTHIKLQIARTAVFYGLSLGVFLASIFSIASECMTTTDNSTMTTEYCCWENEVGEQMFQVVVLDLLIGVGVGLVTIGARTALVKCGKLKKLGYPEFDVPGHILDLVYGQSLVWLGLYSAPFLALVGGVKLVVMFYFYYVLSRVCCVPPSKVFRASRSGTFFLFILLLSLFTCLGPILYTIVMIEPSESCGPFRQEEWAYSVLTDKIGDAPGWVGDGLVYITHPATVISLFLLLLLITLYYRSKSAAHRQTAKDLRHHLQFERKVEKRRIFARAKLAHGISQAGLLDQAGRNHI